MDTTLYSMHTYKPSLSRKKETDNPGEGCEHPVTGFVTSFRSCPLDSTLDFSSPRQRVLEGGVPDSPATPSSRQNALP